MKKNNTIEIVNTPEPNPGTFGKSELYALSIGQVIGAGIITLVGPAITMTGYSTWLAYLVAILLGFLLIVPIVFVTSTVRLGGGYYSLLGALAGPKVAGMYAVAFMTKITSLSLFGRSLGVYAESLFPNVNGQIVGIVFLTIFYVINLYGVNAMAGVQKIMTWVLIAALVMFILVGFPQITNPIFDFSSQNYFRNGRRGFMAAAYLFVYSTNGYSMTMNYGRESKNATRDIPWAILMSVPTLMLLYCGVAMVGSGVLPIEVTEGQPLTVVAREILSTPLFTFFMIGGPIMALTSTINSSMAYYVIPLKQSCEDGWLPKSLAEENKRGVAWKILTIVYLVGMIPLLLNFDVTTITNNIMLFDSSLSIIYIYAYWKLPDKYPNSWKKSKIKIPVSVYRIILVMSTLTHVTVLLNSASSLNFKIVITSIIAMILCVTFGFVRGSNADISMETSVWPSEKEDLI